MKVIIAIELLLNSLSILNINIVLELKGRKRWRSWLTHCTTSRRRAGSTPDCVIGIFYWHKPSGRTVALGSTRHLIEMSTRNIFWGLKTAGAQSWQSYHINMSIALKDGSLNLLVTSGLLQVYARVVLLEFKRKKCWKKIFCPKRVEGQEFSGKRIIKDIVIGALK